MALDVSVPKVPSDCKLLRFHRTATMTRSADGYAQGMAYATACANPEGPLRTPDAQAGCWHDLAC